MAMSAAMVFEIRTAGSGSGGYKTGASGTDRSQQDAPYIGPMTDIEVKGGVFNRIYSVTEDANFVADLIGNTVRITGGTNFIVNTYEITAQGNDGDNYLQLDSNCASGNSNDGAGMIGGALPSLATLPATSLVAGNICYYEAGGTHVVTTCSVNGAYNNRIQHIGYNSSRGDDPIGNNRPLVQSDDATYWYLTGDYQDTLNMRFLSTAADYGVRMAGDYNTIRNCRIENSKVGGSPYGLHANGTIPIVEDCEIISASYYSCYVTGLSFIARCYVHDANRGFFISAGTIVDCIADTCAGDGITLSSTGSKVMNNTVYNCLDGIDAGSDSQCVLYNNQLINNTTGFRSGAAIRPFADYNNYYDNTADLAGAAQKGPNATANDPDFTDAPGGDFSGVASADGAVIRLGVG